MRLKSGATLTLVLADACALPAFWPHWDALARGLSAPARWVERIGADGAATQLAGAALWATALWLGAGLLAVLAAQLPGAAGTCSDRLARAVLPPALYRVAAGAAGLGMLLAPVAAGARQAPPATSIATAPLPSPTWPTGGAVPAPELPTSPPLPARAPVPATPSHTAPPPQPPAATSLRVVVRPGDSLWSIAARHLGPGASAQRIAAEWPRWFAANHRLIGSDPSLIKPGQVLHAPVRDPEVNPS